MLSVCCLAHGEHSGLLSELERLRPHVEEIVVGVDSRAPHESLSAYAEVADRVLPFEYAPPTGRQLGWLHAQCSSRWILRLDHDEVAGESLVRALRDLVTASDVTHYWLPRRWLYPDGGQYLDQRPWTPDYQLRMVRNDPCLLRFPGQLHSQLAVHGPGRYIDVSLYHADCVLHSREEREQKAAAYEQARPGLVVAGRPVNSAYYVPEGWPSARTSVVPAEDRQAIESFLRGGPASIERVAPWSGPSSASRAEIDRFWEGRTLDSSAYYARLTLLEETIAMYFGEVTTVDVEVANRGNEVWPWGLDSRPEIRLSYRWLSHRGEPVEAGEYLRTPFPVDVRPGAVERVPVYVMPPRAPGTYLLELDLVHEHVRWFRCPVRAVAEVRAPAS